MNVSNDKVPTALMKENEWLVITSDIWIEIFLWIDDLKKLSKLKRVCKRFEKLISTKSFFKRWNSIFSKDDIPKFETNNDLIKRFHYKRNFESGKPFLETKIAFQESLELKDSFQEKKSSLYSISLSTHLWEPFYLVVKTNHHDYYKPSCSLIQLFKEGVLIKTFDYKVYVADNYPAKSDIPGYLFLFTKTMENSTIRLFAIPTRKNLKTLYYDLPVTGHRIDNSYFNGLFSISLLIDEMSPPEKRTFFQFSFDDFHQEGEDEKEPFKVSRKETQFLQEIDSIQTSHRSICYFNTNGQVCYFSFDDSFNMEKSDQLLKYNHTPLLVFNEKEEFLIKNNVITRCKSKQTKKLNAYENISYENHAFINSEGNIIVISDTYCLCINTKEWDNPKNENEIHALWIVYSQIILPSTKWTPLSPLHLFFFNESRDFCMIEKKKLNLRSDFSSAKILDKNLPSFEPISVSPFMIIQTKGRDANNNLAFYYLDFLH